MRRNMERRWLIPTTRDEEGNGHPKEMTMHQSINLCGSNRNYFSISKRVRHNEAEGTVETLICRMCLRTSSRRGWRNDCGGRRTTTTILPGQGRLQLMQFYSVDVLVFFILFILHWTWGRPLARYSCPQWSAHYTTCCSFSHSFIREIKSWKRVCVWWIGDIDQRRQVWEKRRKLQDIMDSRRGRKVSLDSRHCHHNNRRANRKEKLRRKLQEAFDCRHPTSSFSRVCCLVYWKDILMSVLQLQLNCSNDHDTWPQRRDSSQKGKTWWYQRQNTSRTHGRSSHMRHDEMTALNLLELILKFLNVMYEEKEFIKECSSHLPFVFINEKALSTEFRRGNKLPEMLGLLPLLESLFDLTPFDVRVLEELSCDRHLTPFLSFHFLQEKKGFRSLLLFFSITLCVSRRKTSNSTGH